MMQKIVLEKLRYLGIKKYLIFAIFVQKETAIGLDYCFVILDTDNSNWYQPRHIFVHILALI
jgi:hypothetical protein